MQWYNPTVYAMEPDTQYSHGELVGMLAKEKPGLSKSGYHWAINGMIKDGLVERKGYGKYSLTDGVTLSEYQPAYSDMAEKIMKRISREYPYVQFTVFETVLMNDFLNHLIAQNTVFIHVERESSIYVFRFLQEKGYRDLMYKPGKKEFRLYWGKDAIVVADMISESPLRADKPHSIMLEKMLVDMCADKLIATTFSRAELPDVFAQAEKRYKLDKTRMLRYARRRNKEDEVKRYLEG